MGTVSILPITPPLIAAWKDVQKPKLIKGFRGD